MKPIFIDVDGTLRNNQKEITAITKKALCLATQKGYEPIICTGRPCDYALNLCEQLRSKYLICNSGALVYDCQVKRAIYENSMDKNSIVELYHLLKDNNVKLILEYNKTSRRYSLGNLAQYEFLKLENLQDILSKYSVQQVVVDGFDFEFMRTLREKINQIPNIKTSNQSKCLVDPGIPHTSSTFYYDIVSTETSKGNGIRQFCKFMHISPTNCIAIGDDENDISMFKTCGYNVAMGNALPNVKSIADYVTLDNEHDGVAYFIQQKLLS